MLKRIERFFLNNEVWMFCVAIICISLYHTNAAPPFTWNEYLSYAVALFLAFAPVLTFVWFKPRLKAHFNKITYLLLWSICFIIYPSFIVIAESAGIFHDFINENIYEAFITTAIIILSLEVALEINTILKHKLPRVQWIKKIGLEKAVLTVLVLLSVIISMMAVSSFGIPEYDMEEQLLIGFVFDFEKISKHFMTFLTFILQFLIFYLAGYFFYYINHYFLIQKLLKEKGLLVYAIGVVGTIALFYPILGQLLIMLPLNEKLGGVFRSIPFDSDSALGALAIMIFTLPVILAIQWFKQNNEITSLEKEKVQTELDMLKQQINPHFFFNTLNNLYSLSLAQSEKAPEVIMRLSELMRYVIYKGKEDKVLLAQEVKYIEDYLHLQQLRLRNNLMLTFDKKIKDVDVVVPPLLLIILVENAFKHGVEPAEKETFLHLTLHSDSNSLTFICENSFEPQKDHVEGIGLSNLKRRLDLLFPNKHQLLINKRPNVYTAELKLYF